MNENEQAAESAPAPENEQVPVWVKLVDVSSEVKQGYRPVGVFLTELPRVTFEWAVIAVRNILLALLFWLAIIAVVGFALFLVFGMIIKITGAV